MIWNGVFFYLFASITVFSAFMVITARNPVHSVLFLIMAFFNSAGLFVLLGAEFLAMILVIVYVGAVAVLFLFVVMMLDIDFAEMRAGFVKFLPLGGAIGLVLLMELIAVQLVPDIWQNKSPVAQAVNETGKQLTNTEAIGQVLYTKHVFFFQAAGIILLVAMIGAIVLTLKQRQDVKRQNIAVQVARTPEESIEIKQVEPGAGI